MDLLIHSSLCNVMCIISGLVSGDRYQMIGALWIWACGDVSSDNETRVGVTSEHCAA